jgi:carboxyl-terminal processing protease
VDGIDASQQRVRRYLLHALEIIERRALHSDTMDWAGVRAAALARCAGATGYADTHETIAGVLRQAGGPHSGFRPSRPDAARIVVEPPTGGLVDGVAHLRLPGCGGGHRAYRAAGHRLMRRLADAGPAGWVVDLRGNRGGNMWPMLAVVAPLLPYGVLGYFVPPAGPDQVWQLRWRRVLLSGRTQVLTAARRRLPATPVAVLTDARTASSGEAVAVAFRGRPQVRAFGTATMGMTSANETHPMRDGALMYVTTAYFADHRRTVYRGPLQPDDDGGADPLAAAVSWILRPS